jgi:hypothetical protein
MIQTGELIRFKTSEQDLEWKVGLVVKFDKFLRVVEVLVDGDLYYAPQRLVKPYLEA